MKRVSRYVEWRGELREDFEDLKRKKKGWDWRGELR